ncbi:hypothetical protein [Flammeovirga sp. EKP202]|uniref:hypothetical protein n=1 Tax=Flammeovirga sp. EKP202 TaxID=2770592 RepID=UPI00165FB40A|nr:hypothetical protein [Flammeovirga sp. EKP202]MBD0401057.1 hypothetical protein [Flammeovirga sp. EKP202]
MKKVTHKRSFNEAFQIALNNHSLFNQETFDQNYQALHQRIESSSQNNASNNRSFFVKTLNSSISKS